MKRILALVLLCVSATAMAQHHHPHGGWRHHHGYGWGWSVPILVGGAIVGYELSRANQPTVVVQQPPNIVYIPSPVAGQPPNCTMWVETQNSDGTITRTRTCTQ